jgi:hypothetical protein
MYVQYITYPQFYNSMIKHHDINDKYTLLPTKINFFLKSLILQ